MKIDLSYAEVCALVGLILKHPDDVTPALADAREKLSAAQLDPTNIACEVLRKAKDED